MRGHFDLQRVHEALCVALPAFRTESLPLSRDHLVPGDTVDYNIRVSKSELYDLAYSARATIKSVEGDQAVATLSLTKDGETVEGDIQVTFESLIGRIPSDAGVSLGYEVLPTVYGEKTCDVRMYDYGGARLGWFFDGIVYRNVLDQHGFRLYVDVVDSSLLQS